MSRKLVFVVTLALVLIGMVGVALKVQRVEASGTIYIRADGSVEGTTHILTVDNVTYTFTYNIYDEIVVEKDDIVVDGAGYTLQGSGSGTGIDLSYRSNVTIKNARITGFTGGIYLYSSTGNTLFNNTIIDMNTGLDLDLETGIHLQASSNNTIIHNNISNFYFAGIYLLQFSGRNILSENNISSAYRNGIHLYSSSHNEIYNNTFVHCGLFVRYSYQNVVENNVVDGKSILYLEDVSDYIVKDEVQHFGQIIVVSSFNITVENVSVYATNIGIEFFGTRNSRIIHCNVSSNMEGIYLGESDNNIIVNNVVTNNLYRGMMVTESKNNIIMNNTFEGSGEWDTGLHVHHYFSTEEVNTHILFNNFTQCKLFLDRSSDNYIYLNNFISSNVDGGSYETTNIWNTPLETSYTYEDNAYTNYLGNYWSDYTGSDANNDGIGDSSHNTIWDDKDNYPLMKPFENYYGYSVSIHVAWSTDSAGNSKSTYQLSDNVYVKGQNFPVDTDVTIYLIPDEADALPANVVASSSTTTDSTGGLPVTLVWSQPLTLGKYDIWVDVNQNGVFDEGDVWNSQSIGVYGLDVIPEFPSFFIMPLFMIATLLAAILLKKRKHLSGMHAFVLMINNKYPSNIHPSETSISQCACAEILSAHVPIFDI